MRRWVESAKRVMPVLLAGCQPPPSEVETVIGASASGASSTTAVTGPGTSTPGDTTVAASGDDGSSDGPLTGTVDSSSSDGTDSTDSTGEPTDEPLGMFGAPVLVAVLSSVAEEDDPTLTGDMLEIYFGSTRNGTEDVWMSTRDTVADEWDAPERVDEVSSNATDTLPEVSADGLFMLLASDRANFSDLDVYFTRRGGRDQPWPAPQVLAGAANFGSNDFGATPSPDLGSVFLCRTPIADADVFEAPADFETWVVQVAVPIPELTSLQDECTVSLSPSRREIFIETNRVSGTLGWNLWTSTRAEPDLPWGAPIPVDELNTNADEQDPWLSPDRHTLWFASNRLGNLELYVATRG